jgi:deazaflavin-dependent oxidoreductase (nitroreductase family)
MSDPNDYNRQLIETFRVTRDTTGTPLDGRSLLLLTTTGARTGLPRTIPLTAIHAGDRLLIVASNGGAQTDPAWYHNLLTHPDVTVEVGPETFEATASVVEGPERPVLWAKVVELFPFYGDYQAKVARVIPLIELVRQRTTDDELRIKN